MRHVSLGSKRLVTNKLIAGWIVLLARALVLAWCLQEVVLSIYF